MSFLSFFSKKDEKVSLLIDIGNGSVTGALVLFSKGKSPEFLYIEESSFSVADTPNAKKLITDLSSTLESILLSIMKQGFKGDFWKGHDRKISDCFISFSSPWFVSKTKHINLFQEIPFVITNEFLEDIIEKEQKIFKKELLAGVESPDRASFDVIEKSIVHTKINGYILENSVGKKTQRFDAYIYLSVIGKNVIDKVYKSVLKHAHVPESRVLIHTFPLVSFSVIRDVFSASSDFIIMDITSDVTDITLVQSEVIIKTVSMPSGRNFILRQISKKMNFSTEIAESTLRLHAANKLDATTKEKLENILIDVEKEWSIYFENTLQELCPEMHLPSTVYLTCEDDVFGIYSEFLQLSKTDSTAIFRKNIKITKIERETLSHFYTTRVPAKTNQFIAMLAVFYNKFFGQK